MLSNITSHWKTSLAGVLLALVTVAGVLSQQGITLGKAGTGTVVALIAALGTAFLGLLAKDPGSSGDSGNPSAPGVGSKVLPLLLIVGLLALAAPAYAQSAPVQNLYAAGASYSVNAKPAVAGTALYAHAVSPDTAPGMYVFTVVDATPATLKPFTVTTNVGAGIAQKVLSVGKADVYVPTAAGISWTGVNTGWQWSGGALVAIPYKSVYVMPSVRFLKSSVSGGSGYQPIVGVLIGWGK